MLCSRRQFLLAAAATLILPTRPRGAQAGTVGAPASFAPKPGVWRTFEITTAIEVAKPEGGVQVWVPVPGFTAADWMKAGETTFSAPGARAAIVTDEGSGARMVRAAWEAGAEKPSLSVVSRVTTRDRAVALTPSGATALSAEELKRYTCETAMMPLGGIVRETAVKITAGAKDDLAKARAIYEWVVENTFREPKTRGCGTGDVATMLETGNLSGKCADINALYVALARAVGLAARDVYGIRVAPSAFGYKSLGANSATITKAQHCRAEVFLAAIGWVPADPADVRKVVLEEPPGKLALNDPKVNAVRSVLLGAWETNWLAYNDAHDVSLPGSSGSKVPFLMYPQAETAAGRLDPLDADAFKYTITAREITG